MRSCILSVSSLLTISRLGKSGLKVSKVILGCMSYGSSKWQPWILFAFFPNSRGDVGSDALQMKKSPFLC
jgi:hypothetical protein